MIKNVIIFGTGNLYREYRSQFRDDIRIVAFLDNNKEKQGAYLDGVRIYPPEEIKRLDYDFVFILAIFHMEEEHLEMHLQLERLGVESEKIFNMYNTEKILRPSKAIFYGEQVKTDIKQILVVSHALTSTGAQNVLMTAVYALHEMGYSVTVFSRNDGVLREKLVRSGISVMINRDFDIESEKLKYLLSRAAMVIVNTIWLHEFVKKLSIVKIPIFWWIHETMGLRFVRKNLMFDLAYSRNIHICVISDMVRRLMKMHYVYDFEFPVLSCGIGPQKKMERNAFSDRKIVFGIVGTFDSSVKGQDILISAVEMLDSEYQDKAEFWFVGVGKLQDCEIERIRKCSCMKIIGEIDNSQIGYLYERLDVVVSCSRIEALSVVIIEGSMYQRLVIASNATGISDYISTGQNGFIFQNENVEELLGLLRWVGVRRKKWL